MSTPPNEKISEANAANVNEGGHVEVAEVATADVHDPLNWPALQKLLLLNALGLWIFLGTANALINGSALYSISAEFSVPIADTTYLIGAVALMYGTGSIVWVAIGNRYGVRLTFVLTATAAACMAFWGAKATSFGSLIGARILSSFFYSSPETLGPQVAGDVFFLKDRAKVVTFIVVWQGSGFALGPLIGAYIFEAAGWRWTQYFMGIATLTSTCILFLFYPETQYTRDHPSSTEKRRLLDNLRFWSVSGGGRPKVHSFWSAFLYPFPYILHPVVFIPTIWAALGLMSSQFLLTVATFSYQQVYSFDVKESGLANLSPFIGVLTAIFLCGYLSDVYEMRTVRLAAESGRDVIPEKRLILTILPAVLGIVGTALFGACNAHHCHWLGPMAGAFGSFFSFIGCLSILFTYFLDVYEARTDAVLVVLNGVKNFAAFGISYAVFPWVLSAGYVTPFVVLSMVVLFSYLLLALLYFTGPRMRRWTAARFETGKASKHGDTF
ncbi:hypothetical protein AYL99_12082 [Fonsecaea erecta]|uniref:Major facilitator superfamily (MFS) profile domain-containing protein n=1 Tax=Fonsecaea erecta TaxID=1367422 RepID=A0A178Z234_9EURO|nr:hypothetical protein AYL99_12082 [Fonsecaea erecta]OAP53744.1 hypothetical protein AYL99_12082 [Fonsecaea erecta]